MWTNDIKNWILRKFIAKHKKRHNEPHRFVDYGHIMPGQSYLVSIFLNDIKNDKTNRVVMIVHDKPVLQMNFEQASHTLMNHYNFIKEDDGLGVPCTSTLHPVRESGGWVMVWTGVGIVGVLGGKTKIASSHNKR